MRRNILNKTFAVVKTPKIVTICKNVKKNHDKEYHLD